jgi:hypothetical protein
MLEVKTNKTKQNKLARLRKPLNTTGSSKHNQFKVIKHIKIG